MQSSSSLAGARRAVIDPYDTSDDDLDLIAPYVSLRRSSRSHRTINAISSPPPLSPDAVYNSEQRNAATQANNEEEGDSFLVHADNIPRPPQDLRRSRIKRDRLVRPARGEALLNPHLKSGASSSLSPPGAAIVPSGGNDEVEAEAELSDVESEAGSEGSGGSDSSMEWEADEEEMGSELSDDDSDTESTSDITSPSATSIMHLSLSSLTDKFTSLNRKLARLEKTKAAGRITKARAKRLGRQLEAERYTLSLYRQALRKSQAALAASQAADAKSVEAAAAAEHVKGVAEKMGFEAGKQLVVANAKLQLAETLEADCEAKMLLYKCQADQAREDAQSSSRMFAERSAALTTQRFEEVERRQKAEAEREGARRGREEAESKLAMIRDAHDLERAMYLKHIKELEDRVKVKVEGNGRG